MRVRTLAGVVAAIGLVFGSSAARGGVVGTVWIEVDNSVGTVGEAAGLETGLEGVRTFDLYLVLTPGTRGSRFAADFGDAATRSDARSMWTTQSVYQNPFGSDTAPKNPGVLRTADFAALEYDTYVTAGKSDTSIVTNTAILGGDWSPSGFHVIWYPAINSEGGIDPVHPDADNRILLARISVTSEREFGDYSGDDEYLGGAFFISAVRSGLGAHGGIVLTANAFDGPEVYPITTPNGGTTDDSYFYEEPTPILAGDLNYDGEVDADDLAILHGAYGTMNVFYDLNGDRLIEDRDIHVMMHLITGEGFSSPFFGLTPKELRKEEKRYQKVLKKAERELAKERKRQLREREMAVKAAEKERKRLMKERERERKRILREQRREQRRQEREARQNGQG